MPAVRPLLLCLFAALALSGAQGARAAGAIDVVIDAPEAAERVDGRVVVALSRTREFVVDDVVDSSQLFGVTVDGLRRGEAVTIDGGSLGYPLRSLAEVPPGDYWAKAWLNVYTTFERADGHVVKLHMDRGEGQVWHRAPGNLVSDPVRVRIGGTGSARIVLDQIIPPVAPPAETQWVRNFRMRSDKVSRFWGQPMEIGARVLLPRGFGLEPERRYPVVIEHGHFSTQAPGRFIEPAEVADPAAPTADEARGLAFFEAWTGDDFPRFLLVTIQHPTPYYDDSYAVNSANHGPYGDAIVEELLPALEAEFRGIGEPWARILTGGSTGGWESIAQQILYPDFFGGAWVFYPDQVDFGYYQLVDLVDGTNAYWREHDWLRVPIPGARDVDGRVRYSMEHENVWEEVRGTRYRGGGQWAAWNATFAPVAEDGYPEPLWDPLTGEIQREAADAAIAAFDLNRHLQANWDRLAPKLAGKLNVFTGRRDNFYLEQAVYELEKFLTTGANTGYPARFEYGENGAHGWSPWRDPDDPAGLYGEMMEQVRRNVPDDADVTLP
ncbi:MAG TPA: hypothetical protein VLA56_14150 [Pseudomonadales bacterium]|nr:hypothetical protein [Pseudomonadales bacterium]